MGEFNWIKLISLLKVIYNNATWPVAMYMPGAIVQFISSMFVERL